MRYSLRTLTIVLAVAPPAIAGIWLIRHGLVAVGSVMGQLALAALLLGVASAAVLFAFGFR